MGLGCLRPTENGGRVQWGLLGPDRQRHVASIWVIWSTHPPVLPLGISPCRTWPSSWEKSEPHGKVTRGAQISSPRLRALPPSPVASQRFWGPAFKLSSSLCVFQFPSLSMTRMHTQARAYTCTHTRPRKHAHTCSHTHVHTRQSLLSSSSALPLCGNLCLQL